MRPGTCCPRWQVWQVIWVNCPSLKSLRISPLIFLCHGDHEARNVFAGGFRLRRSHKWIGIGLLLLCGKRDSARPVLC